MQLDFGSRTPIFEQIVKNVIQQCTFGILSPGDSLPTVRNLAAELGVNPNTVQKAYQSLETQGFIYTAGVRGSFISDSPSLKNKLRQDARQMFIEKTELALQTGITKEELIKIIEGNEKK